MTAVILLDGGMGQELLARVPEAPTGLWATQVMVDHPGLTAAVHADYFEAGATVATANTYALHKDRLVGTPLEDRQGWLIQNALDEVHSAHIKTDTGKIAGSLGPLVWSYRSEGQPPYAEAVAIFEHVARQLAPRVDFIICETMASIEQAHAALDGACKTGLPVWLSVTLDDEDGTKLRSGEPVSHLRDLMPNAWLANCSAPEAMPAALDVFSGWGKPFGAYANGFTEITKEYLTPGSKTSDLGKRDLTPEVYADHVMSWIDMGATIVGGCCETGPAHIREIAKRLAEAGHKIV